MICESRSERIPRCLLRGASLVEIGWNACSYDHAVIVTVQVGVRIGAGDAG
ncbi:MAG: hypothetical protein AABZ15_05705 [Nitrospirota bacterium]